MCLGVPAQVIRIAEEEAEVRLGEVSCMVSLALLTDVQVGDYVLLHAGFAIGKVSPEDAHETLRLIREISSGEED